jgi:hypothetical protein
VRHTTKDRRRPVGYGAKFIAFALVVGGVLGIVLSVATGVHLVQQHRPLVISATLSAVLFACGVLAGIGLWRGTPRGRRWATILVALQVPVVTIGRVVYAFSIFFNVRVLVGTTTRHIGANIGSFSDIYVAPQSLGFVGGINVAAAIALWCLVRSSRTTAVVDQ